MTRPNPDDVRAVMQANAPRLIALAQAIAQAIPATVSKERGK